MLYAITRHVEYSKDALRTLARMPVYTAKLILSKMDQYSRNPASMVNNVKALQGYDGVMRLRVGDWRVLFSEEGDVIAVIRVAPRGRLQLEVL